jgi:hypothetical protein
VRRALQRQNNHWGIAPIVLSNADLVGGTTKGYRPWFENGSWQGDLVEYTVTASGGLSTSVSFAQSSPTNTGSNWSALVNFAAREEADADYWDTGRKIITFNSSTNARFRFASPMQALVLPTRRARFSR